MGTVFRTRKGEYVPCGALDGSIWTTTAAVMGPEIETCSFCGARAAEAYWSGQPNLISVCRLCAVDVLPRLMADALVGEHGDLPHLVSYLRRLLDQARAAFWEAVSVAMHRTQQLPREGLSRVNGYRG